MKALEIRYIVVPKENAASILSKHSRGMGSFGS